MSLVGVDLKVRHVEQRDAEGQSYIPGFDPAAPVSEGYLAIPYNADELGDDWTCRGCPFARRGWARFV